MRVGPRSRESGASAVEFALILPVLVIILAGTINFGFALVVKAQVEEAAAEAVAVAAREPGNPVVAVNRAIEMVNAADIAGEVTITCLGDKVRSSITHDHSNLVPGLLPAPGSISATSTSAVLSTEECVAYGTP